MFVVTDPLSFSMTSVLSVMAVDCSTESVVLDDTTTTFVEVEINSCVTVCETSSFDDDVVILSPRSSVVVPLDHV